MSQPIAELPLADLPPGALKRLPLAGTQEAICLAHTPDGIYAVHDCCTHARIPLSDGALEGRQVICPWHGAMFDMASGRATCGPAVDAVRCYPVRQVGDRIQVLHPDPAS